jgi:hypothetical protein
MSSRKTNIITKIGNLIPGFKGYSDRTDRRNSEKIFREQNFKLLEQCEASVIAHQKHLITSDQLDLCKQWEIVRKATNTVASKIKHAIYGESSFFAKEQIKEIELDEILTFDEEIAERIQLIFKTCEIELNEILSAQIILNNLKEIESLLFKRLNFISRYK